MKPTTIIRVIVFCLLMIGVYGETGVFTVLALTLTYIGSEATTYLLEKKL